MTDDTVAQRAYIKDIANAALKLVNLTKYTFEDLAVEVIKSKYLGSTAVEVISV